MAGALDGLVVLDLKPTAAERARLLTLIDARVSLRLPAPYLVGAAYMHGVRFQADRRALIPRSFIGCLQGSNDAPQQRLRAVIDHSSASFFPWTVQRYSADLSRSSGLVAHSHLILQR